MKRGPATGLFFLMINVRYQMIVFEAVSLPGEAAFPLVFMESES